MKLLVLEWPCYVTIKVKSYRISLGIRIKKSNCFSVNHRLGKVNVDCGYLSSTPVENDENHTKEITNFANSHITNFLPTNDTC